MGKPALFVIDMQNDFCLPGAPFEVRDGLWQPVEPIVRKKRWSAFHK